MIDWRTVLLITAFVVLTGQPAGAADTTILHGSKVYTAPEGAPIEDGVILMRDGKIVDVGPRSSVKVPDGANESKCSGGIIASGFQNSHVHFTEPKWNDAATQPAADLSKHLAEMLLRFGFVTVIDTASAVDNTVALRKRIERGEVPGPRILTAGAPLYPPEGIPFYLRDLPPEVLSHLQQPTTAAEAVADVRENFRRGADATKLFVATPQTRDTVRYMPIDIAQEAAQETHRRGRLVIAHPTDIIGIRASLLAGVDILAHTTLGSVRTEWDPELVQEMITHDIALIPTLKLWTYELKKAQVSDATIELAVGDTLGQLSVFAEAGGQVLFGTDVGYMTDYDPTDEYVLMLRAGLTSMDILASLTTAPAARWKEGERRGRVSAGMDADLVVLTGDPESDVRNYAKVRCAFRKGTLIYPR